MSQNPNLYNNPHLPKAVVIVALGALVLGGKTLVDRANQGRGRTVTEIAQVGDNPWSMATRAEKDYGNDPGGFVVSDEADRIVAQYGPVIHPGEKIQVHVN